MSEQIPISIEERKPMYHVQSTFNPCGQKCTRKYIDVHGVYSRAAWVCPVHGETMKDELLTPEAWIEQLTRERDEARQCARLLLGDLIEDGRPVKKRVEQYPWLKTSL